MPRLIHEETVCCGSKRCPTLRQYDDGSAELSDDDAPAGSVGVIKLNPEVAKRIAELLSEKK